jgi:hypothetical protein
MRIVRQLFVTVPGAFVKVCWRNIQGEHRLKVFERRVMGKIFGLNGLQKTA